MSKLHKDIDKAIRNIIKWSERPEWVTWRDEIFEAHLDPVCGHFDLDMDELIREMEIEGYANMVFGIQFEDFISRDAEGGANPVDDYLKRHGWRESVRGRRYLNALRNSVLSLYEIIDVSPGDYCDIRDLMRGGEPLRVYEASATYQLVKWDRIAARVLNNEDGKHIFAGDILHISTEAAQKLLQLLARDGQAIEEGLGDLLADISTEQAERVMPDLDICHLRAACPLFTNVWLLHTLEHLHAPLPEMYNSDGDPITFFETHFPLVDDKADTRAAVIQRLNNDPEWIPAGESPPFWNWHEANPPSKKHLPHENSRSIDNLLDGRDPVSGTLELTDKTLIFVANSDARTERGKARLGTLLNGLVKTPLSQIQTPEQALADNLFDDDDDVDHDPTPAELDPDTVSAMLNDYLDQHYRQTLDQAIPMLNNKTPRQCAASDTDRPLVIDWLKQLENNELRRAAGQGVTPYDTAWMWEELGLESEQAGLT